MLKSKNSEGGTFQGRLMRLTWLGLYILLAASLLLYICDIPEQDEAMLFLQSKLMAQGWLPYRDFFQFLFPGTLILGAAIIHWIGPSITALRGAALLLQCLALWCVLEIARPYLRASFQKALAALLLGVVIAHAFLYSHHTISGALAVISAYCVIKAQRQKIRLFLALGGLSCGLVLLTTQSLGGLLGAAFIGYFLWAIFFKPKASAFPCLKSVLIFFILPALLPLGGFLLYALQSNILLNFYQESLVWLLQKHYLDTTVLGYFIYGWEDSIRSTCEVLPNRSLNCHWPFLPFALSSLLVGFMPVFGLWTGIWWLFKQRKEAASSHSASPLIPQQASEIALFLLLVLVMLGSTISHSTTVHIASNGWFGYLLAAIGIQGLFDKLGHKIQKVLFLLFILFLAHLGALRLYLLFYRLEVSKNWVASYGTTEQSFYSAAYSQFAPLITELIRSKTQPNEPIFTYSFSPTFYILADRPPATRFLIIYPVYTSPQQVDEIISDLTQKPPTFIIYDRKDIFALNTDIRFAKVKNTPARHALDPLTQLIATHYQLIAYQQDYQVYLRKDALTHPP